MTQFFIAVVAITLGWVWWAEIVATILMVWVAFKAIPLLGFVKAHPFLTLSYTAAYFLIGAAWSVVKWWFVETNNVAEAKEKFAELHQKMPSTYRTWEEYASIHKTKVVYERELIYVWIGFWPFNMVWTLIDDPIRKLCQRIYRELQAVYQRITDSVWK